MVSKAVQKGAVSRRKVAPDVEGIIRKEESYTLQEFLRRVAWRRAAFRAARKRGLKVVQSGARIFVRGSDWHDFLALEAAGAGSSSESAGG